MSDHDIRNQELEQDDNGDSYADAFAAVVIILIAVATAVFWISQQ
ncbi:hypothetical protein [Halopseudomonas salegens]|uniref:Uncharacterized protein n=1 Tax=Halopseudomonas salegens TaxID=1434072 RepID=A0A1H2FIC2_9GAMM|nr:hypothetical protein [Halopseudomonas salegens]SDU07104.1 hypothetical protein SAMN05216210_1583 [Halopseudomonas salegens]